MGSIIPSVVKGRKERQRRRRDGALRLVPTYERSAGMYTTSKGSRCQLADAVAASTVGLVVCDPGSEQSFKFIGGRPPRYFGMLFYKLKILGPPYVNSVIEE